MTFFPFRSQLSRKNRPLFTGKQYNRGWISVPNAYIRWGWAKAKRNLNLKQLSTFLNLDVKQIKQEQANPKKAGSLTSTSSSGIRMGANKTSPFLTPAHTYASIIEKRSRYGLTPLKPTPQSSRTSTPLKKDDLDESVLHADLDAETAELAAGAGLEVLVVLGHEVCRVRVEAVQHAANGVLDQFLFVDRFDVIRFDLGENLGESLQVLEWDLLGLLQGVDVDTDRQRKPEQCSTQKRPEMRSFDLI